MSRIETLPPETGRDSPPESDSDGRVILLWLLVLALVGCKRTRKMRKFCR
jgi:hypothetical protein